MNSPMPQVIKDAYLLSREINVIIVDWQEISMRTYFSAKDATPEVGEIISEFVREMMGAFNLYLNRTSFVGHSLGAHVAGFASRKLDGNVNFLIGKFQQYMSTQFQSNSLIQLLKFNCQYVLFFPINN